MERSQNWRTLYHLLHMKFRISRLVDTLVTHVNTNGVWPNFLFWRPPSQLKTKTNTLWCRTLFSYTEKTRSKMNWFYHLCTTHMKFCSNVLPFLEPKLGDFLSFNTYLSEKNSNMKLHKNWLFFLQEEVIWVIFSGFNNLMHFNRRRAAGKG